MKRVAFFRPGSHRSRQQTEVTLTGEDLAAAAAAYDPQLHAAPLVLGHPQIDHPSFGRIGRLEFDEGEEVIYATDFASLDADFSQWVADGRYDQVSVSWYPPDHPANPKPGVWYPRHLGFLGAHPPALRGLPAAEFGDDGAGVVTIDFAEGPEIWTLRSLVRIARRFRDWIVSERGADEAEKVIPASELDYLIEDLASQQARQEAAAPSFSEPTDAPSMTTDDVQAREAALAAREQQLQQQEADLEARRQAAAQAAAAARRAEFTEFAESLTADGGRFRPDQQAVIVETLCAIDALERDAGQAMTIEFGEGDDAEHRPLIAEVKRLLSGAAQQVPAGQIAPDGDAAPTTVDFAAPDRYTVDASSLAVYQKAKAYAREHGVSFEEAVRELS